MQHYEKLPFFPLIDATPSENISANLNDVLILEFLLGVQVTMILRRSQLEICSFAVTKAPRAGEIMYFDMLI